jgi:hypothetical protein
MGGGAASSMLQGDNRSDLDFNAVQRGDAEMAQKVNRVIRACVELGARNPIVSIHDQVFARCPLPLPLSLHLPLHWSLFSESISECASAFCHRLEPGRRRLGQRAERDRRARRCGD